MFNKKKATQSDEVTLKKNIEYLSWIQEFSKKIVFITFIIFILANLFSLIALGLEFYMKGEIVYIDTFISEIHSTFREVIGGYMLKAATENVFKIGGSYMESYMKAKAAVVKNTILTEAGLDASTESEEEPCEEEYTEEYEDDPISTKKVSINGTEYEQEV